MKPSFADFHRSRPPVAFVEKLNLPSLVMIYDLVDLCVSGAHPLSSAYCSESNRFPSTWQAEQKKVGKADMCICCTVTHTYGKRRETAVSDFHAASKC